MACMRLGSKSEAFHREGQSWHCTSGLPSDVTVEIGEMSFHLHKFPLLSRSGLLDKMIRESNKNDGSMCILQLGDIPGGAKAFELVAKFCYSIKIELTASNIVSLRCSAEYLQMTEDYGEGNLIVQTELFLNEVFANWTDTIKALETCQEVIAQAEDLHIVPRCIHSLAMKACADTTTTTTATLFNWPVAGCSGTVNAGEVWNGISSGGGAGGGATKLQVASCTSDDWWFEDVCFISLPFFKRFVRAVEDGGMKPENIASSLVYYAKKYIPLMNRQSSFKDASQAKSSSKISTPSETDQKALLEEIVGLLTSQKGVVETRFVLRLLRTAMMLQTSQLCRESLERRVGMQLDQASLDDLLIPNIGYSVETLYDIDCFQRILDHFMLMDHHTSAAIAIAADETPFIMEETTTTTTTHSLTSITRVANLVDSYLAEVAPDVNLKFPKFQALAAAIPDYARPLSDAIYRAIDIYLKAHPWLADAEREQICRLMNCQKLSLEASTHAAQNERLPLRVIVQVLFFEQLRLRTSISGWFFVSDNLEGSQNQNDECHEHCKGGGTGMEDMRHRVADLEKECQNMREEVQKLAKTKRGWNFFSRRKSHYNSRASRQCNAQPAAPLNREQQTNQNGGLA
ncbi:PREDICTED: BTB/POZ domain-containing protein At5g03250 [Ipomoea nil]|uniref:BTB/POZ domain-containing protein At5g03250 n=1 Tax=Ipomoea nil TaxID=35883 RepID=UPI000901F593|nr:PREDICTED: BTB/POZ domain-containing protein At5g03250 [Ipomoea nil]